MNYSFDKTGEQKRYFHYTLTPITAITPDGLEEI